MKIDKENLLGEINLSSLHALVMGNKPHTIKVKEISNKLKNEPGTEVQRFGLFETATPNYTTYYPDVKVEDLNPVDADFINPVFRMLSETIVSKHSPIDFGKKGVLKKSMGLLLGQTINIDHETAVGNAIGAISKVFWQKSYTSKDGITVPAGINAVMKIDGKSNPRIARGIMMEPPSIHSNSVTVRFKWEPSHTYENMSEFYNKVGTYDDKGELIRLVVVEITNYSETSLVGHGADTFAQKVGEDGEIVNPSYGDRNASFSIDKPVTGNFSMEYKTNTFNLTKDNSIPIVINNAKENLKTNKAKMEELIKDLTAELGFEENELTAENIKEKLVERLTTNEDVVTEVDSLKEEKKNLEGEIVTLKKDKKGLEDEVAELTKNSTDAEVVLANTKKEAVRLYKLAKGKEAEDALVNLINSSKDIETVASFLREYQKETDKQFGQKCGDCGSENISRASAKTSKEGLVLGKEGEEEEEEDNKELSTFDTIKAINKKNKRKSIFLSGQSTDK